MNNERLAEELRGTDIEDHLWHASCRLEELRKNCNEALQDGIYSILSNVSTTCARKSKTMPCGWARRTNDILYNLGRRLRGQQVLSKDTRRG